MYMYVYSAKYQKPKQHIKIIIIGIGAHMTVKLYEQPKLPEPVGRVQFVFFEKFTSAYMYIQFHVFQIAQEKSCDDNYLIIIIHDKIGDG